MEIKNEPIEIPPGLRPVLQGNGEKAPSREMIEVNYVSIIPLPMKPDFPERVFMISFILVRQAFPLAGIPYVMNVSREPILFEPIRELQLLSLEEDKPLMEKLREWLYIMAKKIEEESLNKNKRKVSESFPAEKSPNSKKSQFSKSGTVEFKD